MRHQGTAGLEGGLAVGEGCIGMADGRDDAPPPELRGKSRRAAPLGGKAPAGDVGRVRENLKVLLRTGIPEITGILCAGLLRGEEGPFQVHSAELGPVAAAQRTRFLVGGETGVKRLVGARERRGEEQGRPVAGMHPGRREIGFHRSVHEVRTAGAVGMDVDKAGREIGSSGIDHLVGRALCQGADFSVLQEDAARFNVVLQHQTGIFNQGFHRFQYAN